MKADFERRVLIVTIGAVCFGALVFIISISTDHWVELNTPLGSFRNETQGYLLGHHSGLWRICRREVDNRTQPIVYRTYCRMLKFFATEQAALQDPELDTGILHYSRSETAFAVISLLLCLLALLAMLYTLQEPRYMFKRLAALLNLMTAICLVVCLEVFMSSVRYEKKNLHARHPEGATVSYGWSYGIAWVTFAIQTIATIVFIICGRKRKGDKARTDDEAMENEPVHLGRL